MSSLSAGLSTIWKPVALSHEVGSRPLARRLSGVSIILFRTSAGVTALKDRCPHRNYPLSEGKVENSAFAARIMAGVSIMLARASIFRAPTPMQISRALTPSASAWPSSMAPSLSSSRAAMMRRSEAPPLMGDPGYDHFWYTRGVWRGRPIDALENILDPFHTNFIHDGLIRDSRRRQLVRQTLAFREGGFEVTYDQQAPDRGWMSRLLEGERTRALAATSRRSRSKADGRGRAA